MALYLSWLQLCLSNLSRLQSCLSACPGSAVALYLSWLQLCLDTCPGCSCVSLPVLAAVVSLYLSWLQLCLSTCPGCNCVSLPVLAAAMAMAVSLSLLNCVVLYIISGCLSVGDIYQSISDYLFKYNLYLYLTTFSDVLYLSD